MRSSGFATALITLAAPALVIGASLTVVLFGGGSTGSSASPPSVADSTDPRRLAGALVGALDTGSLTVLEERYARQLRDVAAGTAAPGCGLDPRILQIITLALERFGSVGVSDLNRQCTGSQLGAGALSSHWVGGGGRAVDLFSLGGVGVTGCDERSLALLAELDRVAPVGTRAGQSDCRAGGYSAIRGFPDSHDHLHLDVAFTDEPLRVGGPG